MQKILAPGTELQQGIYRIEKHLGGGGFGITYLATWILGQQTKFRFVKTGEKTVVIKELFYDDYCRRANNSNEIQILDGQKRLEFERLRKKLVSEANILNSFRHPHIVEVIDVFSENNTAYIVMEYVEGEDMEARIRQKKICRPNEAIRYISQIASALMEVHKKKVLHLDISPSNILIDKNNNAQLIDFGVSLVYDSDTGEVKQTSKLLAGTKSGFSPPEQTLDSLHHFSAPIDLYALGATLYYALTGQKPPDAGSLSAGSESLVRPSYFNTEVSGYLDYLVLKAMNIRITDRFQTAKEFHDALLNDNQRYTGAIHQEHVHNHTIEEVETKLLPDNRDTKPSDKETAQNTSNKSNNNKWLILLSGILFVLLIAAYFIVNDWIGKKPPPNVIIEFPESGESGESGESVNESLPVSLTTAEDASTSVNNNYPIGFYQQKVEKYYTCLNLREYSYIYELFAPQVNRLYNIKTAIGRDRVEKEAINYAKTYPFQHYEIIDFQIAESTDERTVINSTNRYRIKRSENEQEKSGITKEVIVFNNNNQIIEMYNNNSP